MISETLSIGNLILKNRIIAAPMAGISDLPFRQLCYRFGAGMAFSEMFLANPEVWNTNKSSLRIRSKESIGINAVQIVGSEPELMAKTAQLCEKRGVHLIDINMGCPAKKVNKKLAGSALLQDSFLVRDIIQCVVEAVDIPVTLKIRTGWNKANKNYLEIAKIAQDCGIKALTIHGRTRECLFRGEAEYDSIKEVKKHIAIPVIANGDITSPMKAKEVFQYTNADAIMIGRAAQGNPWIFEEIDFYLKHGELKPKKGINKIEQIVLEHVSTLHQFYGEYKGVRIARKHVSWYIQELANSDQFRRLFNTIEDAKEQVKVLKAFFRSYY